MGHTYPRTATAERRRRTQLTSGWKPA